MPVTASHGDGRTVSDSDPGGVTGTVTVTQAQAVICGPGDITVRSHAMMFSVQRFQCTTYQSLIRIKFKSW